MGGFITLVLSAATPPSARGRKPINWKASDPSCLKDQAMVAGKTESAIDAFFWILIASLAVVIICHYIWHPHFIISRIT